ncbi:hypothetical protein [Mangrovitalea sediminis]|uniref:hypothetical protein n=1 Tax=Mangrovitalea sediminis TaxID=1982043 RepID=UPI000BE53011|nr:hypothetical protein [Mangrovitalea sediminis]
MPHPKWSVDLAAACASHTSGMMLKFEGVPDTTNFSVSPGRVPSGLNAVEVVRLIREGVEAFTAEYDQCGTALAAPENSPSEKKNTVIRVRRSRSLSVDRS